MPGRNVKRATPRQPAPHQDIYERVTRLETMMEMNTKTIEGLVTSVDGISKQLTRYQGFWGAVTIIGGAIGTAIAMLWDFFAAKLGIK